MSKSISLLLGAGFSAPMGYPIGNKLNELLLKCDGSDFSFSQDGSLAVSLDGSKPNFGYKTSFDFEFDFCRDLINYYYEKTGYFDYEEFYDYLTLNAKNEQDLEKHFDPTRYHKTNISDLLYGIKNIYNQLVANFLKDGEGKSWYDNEGHHSGPTFTGYTGILNSLKEWGDQYIMNIHTLNHDLFFERLNHSEWIQGELCDGFEEIGSPYYGQLHNNGRNYMCRLQYFTEKYDKKFRLYKLHGSKDYGVYYKSNNGHAIPETYIKTRYGIGFSNIFKEISDKNGQLTYEECWINYHADFLTGTTSKIERYNEPLLFKKLFGKFRDNLNSAERLVIIGYGGKDAEVNRMILENFDYANKPCFIIDPFAGEAVKKLKEILGAKLIDKQLDHINTNDFE